jgi:hypothetical protein
MENIKEILIKNLCDEKAKQNNTIDLNAYAIGLSEMFDAVGLSNRLSLPSTEERKTAEEILFKIKGVENPTHISKDECLSAIRIALSMIEKVRNEEIKKADDLNPYYNGAGSGYEHDIWNKGFLAASQQTEAMAKEIESLKGQLAVSERFRLQDAASHNDEKIQDWERNKMLQSQLSDAKKEFEKQKESFEIVHRLYKQKESQLSAMRGRVEKQQWISVDKALPKAKQVVIVYWEYEGVKRMTSGSYNHTWDYWQHGNATQLKASHWMPLPEPPKEVNPTKQD